MHFYYSRHSLSRNMCRVWLWYRADCTLLVICTFCWWMSRNFYSVATSAARTVHPVYSLLRYHECTTVLRRKMLSVVTCQSADFANNSLLGSKRYFACFDVRSGHLATLSTASISKCYSLLIGQRARSREHVIISLATAHVQPTAFVLAFQNM